MKILDKTIICILLFSLCISCSLGEKNILCKKQSPNGNLMAVISENDYGATTGRNRHISIVKRSRPYPKKGNVFIMQGTDADIYWTDDSTLHIIYKGDVFLQTSTIYNVNIVYTEKK